MIIHYYDAIGILGVSIIIIAYFTTIVIAPTFMTIIFVCKQNKSMKISTTDLLDTY